MKRILVPIDFSSNAGDALRFASEIAHRLGLGIFLFHAYHEALQDPDVSEAAIGRIRIGEKRKIYKRLHKIREGILAEFMRKKSDIKCWVEGGIGLAAEEILDFAGSRKVPVIVMGARGESAAARFFFGSVSTRVAAGAACPVMVIPPGYRAGKKIKMLFAVGDVLPPAGIIRHFFDFADRLDAAAEFVHVCRPGEENAAARVEGAFREMPERRSNTRLRIIKSPDVAGGLNKYAVKCRAGMLIMYARHEALLKKILNRSVSTSMIYHTTIPLLIYPADFREENKRKYSIRRSGTRRSGAYSGVNANLSTLKQKP